MVGIYKNQNKGIYKILNIVNNKFYIGSTNRIFGERWAQHKTELNKNKHKNSYLQNAYNKYGKESFIYIEHEILNNIKNVNKIREREQYWVDNLKPEYNLSCVAAYGEMTSLGKYKMAYSKGLKCHLISPKGIHHCAINLKWFAEDFNLSAPTLQNLCNGKIHHHKKWKGSIILKDNFTPYLNTEKPCKRLQYLLTNSEGVQMCTDDLKKFCEEYSLTYSHMTNIASDRPSRKIHKGWKTQKISEINSLNFTSFDISNQKNILYIWNTKTKKQYIIGNVSNHTHLTTKHFCSEFNLKPENLLAAISKGKKNYKYFVVYKVSKLVAQPTSSFLNKYYEENKNFKIEKNRKCNYIYTLVSPSKETFIIDRNLKDFCLQHNLDRSSIIKVCKGVMHHTKKWTATRISNS